MEASIFLQHRDVQYNEKCFQGYNKITKKEYIYFGNNCLTKFSQRIDKHFSLYLVSDSLFQLKVQSVNRYFILKLNEKSALFSLLKII